MNGIYTILLLVLCILFIPYFVFLLAGAFLFSVVVAIIQACK